MYAAWVVAGWQLGRPAKPYVDDPKYIGGVAEAVYTAAMLFLLGPVPASPVLAVAGLLALGVTRRRNSLRPILVALMATAIGWTVGYGCFLAQNVQRRWFFD
jgi:hypothetical protein